MQWLKSNAVVLIIVATVGWAALVVASAAGFNPSGIKWNFQNTGQLSDSFGIVSTAMAGIAAYFAYRAYKSAVQEAQKAEQRAAEPSFLNLLERRFDVLDRVYCRYPTNRGSFIFDNEASGQAALDIIANNLYDFIGKCSDHDECVETYVNFLNERVTGIQAYHRFSYHIIAFAERQFSDRAPDEAMAKSDPSYGYVRLLRAQLSDSELQLMALNALYGEGNPKLKHYIERYALLHNMADIDAITLVPSGSFAPTAWGIDEADRGSNRPA